MNKSSKKTTANKVISSLENTGESRKDKLLSLIPDGQSPKVYLDLIKSQVLGVSKDGKSREDEDLLLFLYTCKRTGLDPLVKQIYAVYRWDTRLGKEKMSIQVGIDGARLIAQRSTDYAGQDDAKYIPEDESTKYPVKASITVYKMIGGVRVPFTGTARWSEYVQLDKKGDVMGLWSKMPYLMLAKCAESLALRKAFPNELSGIYTTEEMQQSNNILADLPTPEGKGKIKVEYGAPGDIRKTINDEIGTDEAKKQGKKLKNKKHDPEEIEEIPADLGEIRKKLE